MHTSVQLFSHFQLFVTPWTAACQASLSVTNSQTLIKLMSIASVMPSNHLILYRPLLLLSSIFPSIRVFSNESVLHIKWPKYCSFSYTLATQLQIHTSHFLESGDEDVYIISSEFFLKEILTLGTFDLGSSSARQCY